ncbi:MAG: ABC transporter permease, partial [Clostridia bacterium]
MNLPNFMSDIVNVGIQQNGIESGAPDAISKKGYEFLKLFMTDSDKKELDSIYTVRTAHEKNADGKEYITLYSKMSDFDTIYVLSDKISDETKSKTERIFGNALWAMMNVLNSMSEQNGTSESKPETTLDKINIDELYKIQPVIEKLPQKAIDDAIAKADKIDDMLVSQSAVKMVGALYDELGVDVGATQSSYIIKIGSIMLLIALGSGLATIAVTFLSSKIATGVAKNLRNDIFEKVENFSNAENDKFSTASLITRCTNDVSQIQMLLQMGIRMICYAPIMAIGGVIMALNKSVSMAWIIAAACIFLIGFMMVVFFISLPKFKNMQKLIDKVNLIARENLNGLMVIKAFGTRKFEEKRFDDANRGLAKNTLFINRVMSVMMPTMMLMMYSVTIIVIWVGSHYVAESAMQIGDMMAFMQYAMQIIMSFLMISMMFIFIPRASVSAERIADILETKPIIVDPKNPLKMLDE